MNNDLISTINQKLHKITSQSMDNRKREQEEAELQHRALEQAISEKKDRETKEIALAKHGVRQLSEDLDQTIKAMNIQTAKESQTVTSLRDQLDSQMEAAEEKHQERVEEVMQRAEDKIDRLREEMEGKSKSQKEQIQIRMNALSKKLGMLQKDLKEECDNRRQGIEKVRYKFNEELSGLKELVSHEQERRVSTERKIQEMVDEVEGSLTTEIGVMSAKRKKNNEAMLTLIELACQKLQEKSQ